jgi:hypothetical protein
MSNHHAHTSSALIETVAGLSAGASATLAVHPLDVIKTRLQSKLYFYHLLGGRVRKATTIAPLMTY